MTEQLVITQLPQPPTFHLDLFDGERAVGWLSPDAVGFRGFESEAEAIHAAWVAHRTLARRLAHREGRRPIPIDTEPLTLNSDDGVHASGRRIAILIRPGPDSNAGSDTFGFELPFSTRMDEVGARAKSLHIYSTLRRSGIRWAMWRAKRPEKQDTSASTPRAEAAAALSFTPFLPWLPGSIALSSVLLMAAALMSPEGVAPALAGLGLAGLLAVRLFVMSTGWPPRFGQRRRAALVHDLVAGRSD